MSEKKEKKSKEELKNEFLDSGWNDLKNCWIFAIIGILLQSKIVYSLAFFYIFFTLIDVVCYIIVDKFTK